MSDAKARIRELNDQLRRHHRGGKILLTNGVASKGSDFIRRVDQALAAAAFDCDNDPHEEHDFGAIDVEGVRVFFKIDYYDLDYAFASPDPSDQNVTRRVMTIMLAEEY
jgi:hypothetical protein